MKAPESPRMTYVVGNWVRGGRFYGRSAQLRELLSGARSAQWIIGTRRSGKTSLLRQLEWLAEQETPSRYFPVFWDFQGADDPLALRETWADALLDAEGRMDAEAIDVDLLLDEPSLFTSIQKLRRTLRRNGRRLLLLCDEVEELIGLQEKEPRLLGKLRRTFQSSTDVSTILASSIRLWALSEIHENTSPFLHGFTPPIYLARLTDDEARALIRQENLPSDRRPPIDEADVERIRSHCGNQPYLLQVLAKRTLESGDFEEACQQVSGDRMIRHFFQIDTAMITDRERRVLRFLADGGSASTAEISAHVDLAEAEELQPDLYRLENLGYLTREDRSYRIGNELFRRWMLDLGRLDGFDADARLSWSASGSDPTLSMTQTSPEIGRIADRYEILDRVGEGAHGVVYRARDAFLGAVIALKMLKPEHSGKERVLGRLRREVLLSRELGHPGIVKTFHLGTWRGRIYLTMQWIDGTTLTSLLRNEAPLPESEAVRIGLGLAESLEVAHSHNVLHRDLKPDNVLLAGGREPVLTDFGLARIIGQPDLTRSDMFVGTPSYASPEQANQEDLDARSDLYNLGLLLFEMVIGRPPFTGPSALNVMLAHSREKPPEPRSLRPDLSRELSAIILRCLEKRPRDRYTTARELSAELRALQVE